MLHLDAILEKPVGAWCDPSLGTRFTVWAPDAASVAIELLASEGRPPRRLELARDEKGYFTGFDPTVGDGDRYLVRIDGRDGLADPASRFQPEGVFGPSEVVSPQFAWTDDEWRGLALEELTICEAHVGAYSTDGRFGGLVGRLAGLRDVGITALELMPVAQFSGRRGWGYDGVFPFAVQDSYGGPLELKRLVDACHSAGLGLILDVVYNHLGPEGNVLPRFGPYFQNRYHTPWGEALNFDGPHSDEVKRYFCQNLVQWLGEFHVDGLRLDAVHAICDLSQRPLLECLSEVKRELEAKGGRRLLLIAESDLNEPKILRATEHGGAGLDMQWNDDFHHALHALVTTERQGYYQDFGALADLADAYRHGTVYRDRYSSYRRCSRGRSFGDVDRRRFVAYLQNHDQIGNRPLGDRKIAGIGAQELAAACLFLSPFTPQIFMGEERGETCPFPYFADHRDEALKKAVRAGRKREFEDFFSGQGATTPLDPYAVETFESARPRSGAIGLSPEIYRRLIALSKWIRRERLFEPPLVRVRSDETALVLEVSGASPEIGALAIFNFSASGVRVCRPKEATLVFGSLSGETLAPRSAVLFETGGRDRHDKEGAR